MGCFGRLRIERLQLHLAFVEPVVVELAGIAAEVLQAVDIAVVVAAVPAVVQGNC